MTLTEVELLITKSSQQVFLAKTLVEVHQVNLVEEGEEQQALPMHSLRD
jgi:hypothetical protein